MTKGSPNSLFIPSLPVVLPQNSPVSWIFILWRLVRERRPFTFREHIIWRCRRAGGFTWTISEITMLKTGVGVYFVGGWSLAFQSFWEVFIRNRETKSAAMNYSVEIQRGSDPGSNKISSLIISQAKKLIFQEHFLSPLKTVWNQKLDGDSRNLY